MPIMSEKYRTNAFFNGVSTFKAAFPSLTDALVEWRERHGPEDSSGGDFRKLGFRRGNFTQGILPCSNPDCHEGGYQIDRLIAEMLTLGESERKGIMLCSGREIGDETRRGPVRCPHRIEYRATLTVKIEEQRPEKPPEGRSGRRPFNRRGRNRPPRRSNVA